MSVIRLSDDQDKHLSLTPSIRNEITRDLVTQMFAIHHSPNKDFCTKVARKLVQKYPFMRDVGRKVSGYVSNKPECIC